MRMVIIVCTGWKTNCLYFLYFLFMVLPTWRAHGTSRPPTVCCCCRCSTPAAAAGQEWRRRPDRRRPRDRCKAAAAAAGGAAIRRRRSGGQAAAAVAEATESAAIESVSGAVPGIRCRGRKRRGAAADVRIRWASSGTRFDSGCDLSACGQLETQEKIV